MIFKISDFSLEALDRMSLGGKAYSLARLALEGVRVPTAFVIPSNVYKEYNDKTGIRNRIMLELSRKDFSEMRWEEIWDASLRIRNLFIKTDIPDDLRSELANKISEAFENKPTVVRSSAIWEDGSKTSFAGLHESFVNVIGCDSILEHVKLVWASLWSDRALMYRNELGLDAYTSSIAVIIQEMVGGEKSGVIFSKSPDDSPHSIIECVYGLNQGLVDGSISPDRWILSNITGELVDFHPADRSECFLPYGKGGTRLVKLEPHQIVSPPLCDNEVKEVFNLGKFCESFFSRPQDVEWTFSKNNLVALQSRPITTIKSDLEDDRIWYKSLVRSFENLKQLRDKINSELIPAMIEASDDLHERDFTSLSDYDLSKEILLRDELNKNWIAIYWRYFIPFAHGIRLFGQFYNDAIKPEDPYEFMTLLSHTNMLSVQRNADLSMLAHEMKSGSFPRKDQITNDLKFQENKANNLRTHPWQGWLSQYFDGNQASPILTNFLEELQKSNTDVPRTQQFNVEERIEDFLSKFEGESRSQASELLELARYSYRLRDDDNIYLGNIQRHLDSAVNKGIERLVAKGYERSRHLKPEQVAQALADPTYRPLPEVGNELHDNKVFVSKVRQLRGQPAGPGFASGYARVILKSSDLFDIKSGEVLVCDSIDPNMTFVVPLCSAIVERRGGMLIHGAIIAREYGLPCVTGVPDASTVIKTGDRISVDGYLGIVTID